jgi:hypothetical protein
MVASARSGGVVREGDVQAERAKRKVRVRKNEIADTGLSSGLTLNRAGRGMVKKVYLFSIKSTNLGKIVPLLLVVFSPHQPK